MSAVSRDDYNAKHVFSSPTIGKNSTNQIAQNVASVCTQISTVCVLLKFCVNVAFHNRPLAQLRNAHAIGAGGLGFKSRAGQIGTVSPTARHCCDVSPKLYYPGAKPRKYRQCNS